MLEYKILNLEDIITEIEEDGVKAILDSFSSENKDVEDFIRNKAIVFSKMGLAVTYLVYAVENNKKELVGYFTLSNKSLEINRRALSSKMKSKISKFSSFNTSDNTYIISAILIGQFSKNYSGGANKLIRGKDLMVIALDQVKLVQSMIGGKFVYLECENNNKLIKFYEKSGFSKFGERYLQRKDRENIGTETLIQFFKYI